MKKLLLIIICGLALGGCGLAPKKAGIEIMSNPGAKVYLDGKEAGSTPYKNTSLKPGDIEVRLVINGSSSEWRRKITLINYTNTVIDWDFGETDSQSGGYVLYMEKTGEVTKSGLLVNASPDKSAVEVDNEIKGFTPTRLEDIGEGDRQVTISFPGYKTLNLFVKGLNNYQLIVDAKLGQDAITAAMPTKSEEQPIIKKTQVKIKATETGWLRIRAEDNAGAPEIGRANPGDTYTLLEEKTDWYKIDMHGTEGWISARYAEKIEE